MGEGQGFCGQIVFNVMVIMGLPTNNSNLSQGYHETQTGRSGATWLIRSARAVSANKQASRQAWPSGSFP